MSLTSPYRYIGPTLILLVALIVYFSRRSSRRQERERRAAALAAGQTLLPEPRLWPWTRVLLAAILPSSLYLLVFRAISFLPAFERDNKGGAVLMSLSFLFLGPLMAGFITVSQSSKDAPWKVSEWFFLPWLPVLINILLAISVAWEGVICVIFILPPALISASLGGVLAGLLHRYFRRRSSRTTTLCLAVAPLLFAVVETHIHQPLTTRTVDTSVIVHAPAAIVWSNIERARAIAPAELRPSWANAIGFPRPVEATLSHEGIGGVRNASFERGLRFTETVIGWDPLKKITFTIQANTSSIPSTTLDEHVTVGGRFFDVLQGEYDLTPPFRGYAPPPQQPGAPLD